MPANHIHLIAACLAIVLLTLAVAVAMFFARMGDMRRKRIPTQAVSDSAKMAAQYENIQAADNFRNLFEVPVLFFALAAIALATGYVPLWLVVCSWLFVVLRVLHSLIHCTYNRVSHRSLIFAAGYCLLVCMWVAFFVAVASKSAL